MACSDNVVRAGLTPKFKDVETLCSILDYECTSRSERMFRPAQEDEFTLLFKPPVPDFAVAQITVKSINFYISSFFFIIKFLGSKRFYV